MHCKPLPRTAVLYPLSYSPAAGCRPIPAAVFSADCCPSMLSSLRFSCRRPLSYLLSYPYFHPGSGLQYTSSLYFSVFFSVSRYSKRLTNSYLPAALRPPSCLPVHGILRPPCPAHRSPYNRRLDTSTCPRCIFFHR